MLVHDNPCPVCTAPSARIVRLRAGYTAQRCSGCRTVFAAPMPSDTDLVDFYSGWMFALPPAPLADRWRTHTFEGAGRVLAAAGELRGAPIARALDFGGGLGFFAAGLARHGVTVDLFDLSAPAREHARTAFTPITVHQTPQEALAAGPFDLILVNQVIEHVRDPVDFMRTIRPALAPDGLVIVTTPNNAMSDFAFRKDVLRRYAHVSAERGLMTAWRLVTNSWIALDPPRHLFAFNRRSLNEVLARAGYAVRHVTSYDLENDPLGYPAYPDEGSGLYSRVLRHWRRVGGAIARIFDRKRNRRNTLAVFCSVAAV